MMNQSLGKYILSLKSAETDSEVDAILMRYIHELRRDTPMPLEKAFTQAKQNIAFGVKWLLGNDADPLIELSRLDELAESFRDQNIA